MSQNTKVIIIAGTILVLTVAVGYFYYPQLQLSGTNNVQKTTVQDEVRAELSDEESDAIFTDIEEDFAALENDYEFGTEFSAGEFNVPEFTEDFNTSN